MEVVIGTLSSGQGHDTSFAQLVVQWLGVAFDQVTLITGDTDIVKEGGGYYGYHFRLLYGQGPDAPGGAYSYLVNGRMIGGYAAIAWPVIYGDTGVMTFIVSFSGQVYEQDLGPDTAQRAGNIAVFNPDSKWQKSDMTPP